MQGNGLLPGRSCDKLLNDISGPNTGSRGQTVVNLISVRSVIHNLSHCFAIAFFLTIFLFTGLNTTPGYAESGTANGEHLAGHPSKQTYTLSPADPSDENKKPEEKYETVEPITRRVPIWGEQVREKGYDLPLPFGVGTNLVLMDQGIDVRNLKIGFSAPNLDVSSVRFSNARAHDRANTARLDMWLLPFANIYGIFGYINGEAELDVNVPAISVDLPIGNIPISDPQTVKLNIDYNGTTYGGGMTLAGGYKDFFGSLDANYTYSNIDVADSKIEVYTISPRLGMLVDSNAIKGSMALWVGAMYMNYKQTVTESIDLSTIIPGFSSVELDFEIDIKNDHPWNFLFGGQWEITKRWQFMTEVGIGDRKQVISGLFFRF